MAAVHSAVGTIGIAAAAVRVAREGHAAALAVFVGSGLIYVKDRTMPTNIVPRKLSSAIFQSLNG